MQQETTAGVALCALAGTALYLSGANQRIAPRRLPPTLGWTAALALLLAANWLLTRQLAGGAAFFTAATVVMTALTLWPFAALLRANPSAPRDRRPPC